MRHPKTISVRSEEGSAMVELIAWLGLVAVPLLIAGVTVVRIEQAYAATQTIARELAREASLGLDYSRSLNALAGDYGLDAASFSVQVDCVSPAQPCPAMRAAVVAKQYAFLPVATATMLVTP
ncbi:MAG: hypothetical protein RL016_426 [Actinomycetota bacterium]|jgi:uncharacterized membrane protein